MQHDDWRTFTGNFDVDFGPVVSKKVGHGINWELNEASIIRPSIRWSMEMFDWRDYGSNDALPNALAALKKSGLDVAAVDYVFLTHIHLDHAGGAGRMMATFPNARLVVHPRGARHMAEPSKLVAGVSAVYGSEYVARVYGEILPIPAERILEAPDGTVISLAGRELLCLDTPGHARHQS